MINKDKIKGFILGLSVAVVLCSTSVFASSISKTVTAVYRNIKIMIDGEEVIPKDVNGNVVEPFIIDGTTYLPVRAVASALGEDVNWDGDTNTVYIGKMPEKKTAFEVNKETLKSFKESILLKIGNSSVPGGVYNFYVTQNANDEALRYYAYDYSPEKTLQTMTIDLAPAAKYFTEASDENIKLVYAVAEEAEKSGFDKKKEVIDGVNALWEEFVSNLDYVGGLSVFAEECVISEKDLENYAKKSFLTDLYTEDLYEKALKENNNTKSYKEEIIKNYVTAKHILVTDESLANEIISRLNKGESFDILMNEYNTDPGATSEGYTFTYGEMVEPFEKAAFALKENTYTKAPVETAYGYHIIFRCPLNDSAVSEIIDSYKEAAASQSVYDFIGSITEKLTINHTADYEKYITTIE